MLLQQAIGKLHMATSHRLLCGLLVGCPSLLSAQTNLVPNPSFEVLDTCPYRYGFQLGDRPSGWFSWNQTPEYFHACAQPVNGADTMVGVPLNGWAYQPAWNGDAYVGMYAYGSGETYREYVGAELICPLEVGQTYHVVWRANLARGGTTWDSGGSCNNLGALFTMESNAWTAPLASTPGDAFAYRNYAHVYSQEILSDTTDWVLVSGDFVADSAYRYLVLGNFFENDLTEVVPSEFGYVLAYYLVDSVSVAGELDCATPLPDGPELGSSAVQYDQATGHLVMKVTGTAEYRVYDSTGGWVCAGSFTTERQLPTTTWPSGVYLLSLEGSVEAKKLKFVVTH